MSFLTSKIVGFLDGLSHVIETVLYLFGKHMLMSEVQSYGHLETAVSLGLWGTSAPDTLITRNGSAVSVFAVKGSARMLPKDVRDPELAAFMSNLAFSLLPFYKNHQHHLEVFFERDGEVVAAEMTDILTPSMKMCAQHQLDMVKALLGKIRVNEKFCASERIWMVFFTDLAGFSKSEIKEEVTAKAAAAKEFDYQAGEIGSAELFSVSSLVLNRHEAAVKTFYQKMSGQAALMIRPLTAREACRESKRAMDIDRTSSSWTPDFLGDVLIPIKTAQGVINIHPTSLTFQMAPKIDDQTGETVKVGRRYYETGYIKRGPINIESFARLFERIPNDIPWRLSYRIMPEGMEFHKTAKMVSGVLGFFKKGTMRDINASMKFLEKLKKAENPPLGMQMCFQTWAYDRETAKKRFFFLTQQIQGWGNMDSSEVFGDPILGFLSAMPLYSQYNGAHVLVPPLSEAVKLLPLARPASPWDKGSMLFRTLDGKPFPLELGSTLQDTWVYAFISPPGSGKSSTMNSLNTAALMMPGQVEIPFICNLDIGESVRGFIESTEASLPPGKKHYAVFKRIQNHTDDSINLFDTQPGCRYPNEEELQYQMTQMLSFVTPTGKNEPYDGSDGLTRKVIEVMYEEFSDRKNPKPYSPSVDLEVDKALVGLEVPDRPSWWEIVDILWASGNKHASMLAQRHAVPILNDVLVTLNSREVRDHYAKEGREVRSSSTSEFLIDAFSRMIQTAINEYPALANTTKLDLGEARVMAFDLQDVCPENGVGAQKKSGIFMMMARFIFARRCFVNPDTVRTWLKSCPEIYHAYHIKRAADIDKVFKLMSADEIHRGAKIPGVVATWDSDVRTGRKWNLHCSYSTQLLKDIPETIRKFATGVFAMRYDNDDTLVDLKANFSISNVALREFKRNCNGPVPGVGASMLAFFKTKYGNVEQILVNTQSPEEAWFLSSSSQDRWLRKYLFARLGFSVAIDALATQYPNGTCRDEYKYRLHGENNRDADLEEGQKINEDVLQEIANEIVERHLKKAA